MYTTVGAIKVRMGAHRATLRSSEDLFPRPTPHQNLVRIETAIQPAILRLFMFMVLHYKSVATVYSFILNIDIVIHQISTLLVSTTLNKLLICS
jgi:hypothetical protein